MDSQMVERAKKYALYCHSSTNHFYDGKPYSTHLQMVVDVANQFISLLPTEAHTDVLAACWVHDCIEDCRQTYNDVKKATNERIAELAYALTNEKGRTRHERANAKYYQGIRETPFAVFVKLCDRAANVEYSVRNKSGMLQKYKDEHPDFEKALYDARYEPLFAYVRRLLQIEKAQP